MPEPMPTDRELVALKVLWDRGEATVREICEAMHAAGEALAYTTVLSLLQVMEQKGLVSHRQDGKAYIYAPVVERTNTFRQLAGGFLERVFDGAVDEYLVHALGSRKLSGEELAKIEALLEAARGQREEVGGQGEEVGGQRSEVGKQETGNREALAATRSTRSGARSGGDRGQGTGLEGNSNRSGAGL